MKKITRKELAVEIRRNMAIINERVKEYRDEMEESNLTKSNFLDTQIELFRDITKTKSRKKVATGNLSKMRKRDLEILYKQQQRFLESKYSTKEGRQEIDRKKRETLARRGYELSDNQYNTFVNVMNSDVTEMLRTRAEFDSYQILNYIQDDDSPLNTLFLSVVDEISRKLDVDKMEASEIREVFDGLFGGDGETTRESDLYKKYMR